MYVYMHIHTYIQHMDVPWRSIPFHIAMQLLSSKMRITVV